MESLTYSTVSVPKNIAAKLSSVLGFPVNKESTASSVLCMKCRRELGNLKKHRKHIFSLDEVEQGFFLHRFQLKNIGKTTIQRKLYCTTKGSLVFATIVRHFLCLKFVRAIQPVLGAPEEHSRVSANESSC